MESPSIGSLYQDLILEHYRRPRNQGELPDRTADVHVVNPVCGDEIRLQLKITGGIIEQARFVGSGCSISQASASMMTSLLEGCSLTDAEALAKRFGDMMRGDADAARDRRLGDLRALQGVSKFPVRIKCAMLGFDALRKPLEHNSAISGSP